MEVKFTIPGPPKGKGRPRFSKRGDFVKAITPDDTAMYENLVKLEYQSQVEGRFHDTSCLEMEILAYYPIPKSTTKKKIKQMLDDILRPIKKPDADNIGKIVADSLNQIAYRDDTQITDMIIRKRYAEIPRVEVRIKDLTEELSKIEK